MVWLRTADGVRLRAGFWSVPEPKGLVIFCTGRTEFLEKASVPVRWLVERGLAVATVDWRGQGLSDRALDPPTKGHVGHFDEFQRDLAALLAHPFVTGLDVPRILFGHSMGGCIALDAIRQKTLTPACVVLSAPMVGLTMPAAARPVLWVVEKAGLGLGRESAWLPGPKPEQSYVFTKFEGNVLTHDRAMWDWMRETLRAVPALQLGAPTLGWMGASRVAMRAVCEMDPSGLPGLVILGSEEAVVAPDDVRMVAARQGFSLVEIAGGRHETLIESADQRAVARTAIDAFLADQGF